MTYFFLLISITFQSLTKKQASVCFEEDVSLCVLQHGNFDKDINQ